MVRDVFLQASLLPLGHQGNTMYPLPHEPRASSPPSPLLFSILLRVELFDDLEELGIPGVQFII